MDGAVGSGVAWRLGEEDLLRAILVAELLRARRGRGGTPYSEVLFVDVDD